MTGELDATTGRDLADKIIEHRAESRQLFVKNATGPAVQRMSERQKHEMDGLLADFDVPTGRAYYDAATALADTIGRQQDQDED